MNTLFDELRPKIDAEVHFDTIHKRIYSVDASIFEIEPLGIVVPKNKSAIVNTPLIAQKYQIPVISRGAATGIAGECIGHGLIVDTSKYLTRIIEINIEKGYAICEPRVVQDQLNSALTPFGYRLEPGTSTENRATNAGMMANSMTGARSLIYGATVDHVEEVELLLISGESVTFKEITDSEWARKRELQTCEGLIYREVSCIRNNYRPEIEKKFTPLPQRASGYNLDELIKPGNLNLAKITAGSEGTFGIATAIKVSISKKPKCVGLCIIHFHDIVDGMRTIPEMLAFKPIALEIIDDNITEAGRQAPSMRGKREWLKDSPKMIFIAELKAPTEKEVHEHLKAFKEAMQVQNIGYQHVILTDVKAMDSVWELRQSGLGLLLSKRTHNRAIAFIEDLSIPPEKLASFMKLFLAYLKSVGKEAGIYGHVGPGTMHVRPYIDLRRQEDLILMKEIMLAVTKLVLEHEVALSDEHGDGIIRAWLNKMMFGDTLYQVFINLKAAFDPKNRVNPGKIINGQPLLENLRLNPSASIPHLDTFLDFSKEGGFNLAIDLCNGNGMYRKKEGIMCPSYQAADDEYDTRRARAQSLRLIVDGRVPQEDFTKKEIHAVLDLCLDCKECKIEYPPQVDMAKIKSEFLYQYQEKHGYSLRSRLFGHIGWINRMSSPVVSLFNWISSTAVAKSGLKIFTGITPCLQLPQLARIRFSKWFQSYVESPQIKKVVLFNDSYNEFDQPEISKAAVAVLSALGDEIIVPHWSCWTSHDL